MSRVRPSARGESFRANRFAMVAAASALLALAGCGDVDESSSNNEEPESTTAEEPESTTASATEATASPLEPQPLPEMTSITVGAGAGSASSEAFAQLFLAIELGEFEKENLDVSVEVVSDTTSTLSLLGTGDIDAAAAGLYGGFYNLLETGSDIRFVTGYGEPATGLTGSGWYQRPTSDDATPDACALEGQQVGIPPGGTANPVALDLAVYLGTCDLTMSDVEAITVSNTDAQEALNSGAVEIAYSNEPTTNVIVQDEIAALVQPQRPGYGGIAVGRLRSERPEVAQAFIRAMVRTAEKYLQGDYHDDPAVVEAIAEYQGVEVDTVRNVSPRQFDPRLTVDYLLERNPELQEYFLDIGEILQYDTPLPNSDVIDTQFLDALE